jgi:hypothetical protein
MRRHEIVQSSALLHMIAGVRQAKVTTHHIVDCIGLDRTTLPLPGAFEQAYREREDWCRENCTGKFVIRPLGPCPERLYGRRFGFERLSDATYFKMRFPTI